MSYTHSPEIKVLHSKVKLISKLHVKKIPVFRMFLKVEVHIFAAILPRKKVLIKIQD